MKLELTVTINDESKAVIDKPISILGSNDIGFAKVSIEGDKLTVMTLQRVIMQMNHKRVTEPFISCVVPSNAKENEYV